jgi:hypothetical protein
MKIVLVRRVPRRRLRLTLLCDDGDADAGHHRDSGDATEAARNHSRMFASS